MTPRLVAFSPEARDDLLAVYLWIAEAGAPQNALNFVGKIERFCMGLAIAPERGRRLRAYRDRHVRAVGFRRQATVILRVDDDLVTILRIHRAGLDWAADLPQDD